MIARIEELLIDSGAITKAIDKLVAFAGADCLYAPGASKKDDIAAMVLAAAPAAVSILVSVGDALSLSGWEPWSSRVKKLEAGFFDDL